MTALAGWEPIPALWGAGSRITRDDSVTVTLRKPPGDAPHEVLIGMVGYPLDAADCLWLAARLTEAAEAIQGRTVTATSLPSAVLNDAVRRAEDVCDDNHLHYTGGDCFTGRQGMDMVDGFLELGWRPVGHRSGDREPVVSAVACTRCGHSSDWHRLDDALNIGPTDPRAEFRCIGYDCTAPGPPPPDGRACDCPDMVRQVTP